MPVCSYYLRGTCKFGDNCRNEHPRGAFSNLAWTNQNRNGQGPFPFSTESMTKDLTPQMDKPLWPLSSYGPAKGEPNILSGLDLSPEELRVRAVMALRARNANEYITYEGSKITAAEGIYANARTNVQQAYETATKQSSVTPLLATTNTSVFEKPTSAFGVTKAFGQPAFGQSGFGITPPTFSQQSTSTTTSPFGQPSTSVVTGAFGQPIQPASTFGTSTFGQATQPQSSIIKPATGAFSKFATGSSGLNSGTSGGFSAFAGQSTAFGQGATTTTGSATFGQPSFGSPSAFGALAQQPSQPPSQAQTAFGAFGQPTASAFGSPTPATSSAFRSPTQPAQPFATTTPSTLGTTQATSAFSAFGSTSTAMAATTSVSPFAQPSQPSQPGYSGFSPVTSQQPSAFGGASSPAFGTPRLPDTHVAKKSANGPPNFEGIIDTGMQCIIGMGRSTDLYKAGSTPYDAQLPANYAEIIPQEMIEAYKGKMFELGRVPECMPPLEMR